MKIGLLVKSKLNSIEEIKSNALIEFDISHDDDLPRRTASENVLRDKVFKIASKPQYDGCQRGDASMIYKFFDKKHRGATTHTGAKITSGDPQLSNELRRSITKNFQKH